MTPRTVSIFAADLQPGDKATLAWGRPSTVISVRETAWCEVEITYEWDGDHYVYRCAHDRQVSVPVAGLVECADSGPVILDLHERLSRMVQERDHALARVDELEAVEVDGMPLVHWERAS